MRLKKVNTIVSRENPSLKPSPEIIISQNKPNKRNSSLVFPLKITSGVPRRPYTQLKICRKLNKSGKCILNLTRTMILENRKSDHTTGLLIPPITDLEKLKKIPLTNRSNRSWNLRLITKPCQKLSSSRAIFKIILTKSKISSGRA